MNKIDIIEILRDWNFWGRELDIGIVREAYVDRIISLLRETNHVILISGARRAGKSYIMRQVAKRLISSGTDPKSILMINLEDPRLPPADSDYLMKIYESFMENISVSETPYILLDEIQSVRNWQKWVRYAHELRKAKIVVSGSNSKLLGQDISTVLTGRHIDITIFPLSFPEFLRFNGIDMSEGVVGRNPVQVMSLLYEYIRSGSFPEVTLSKAKKEMLLAYFDDVISRDLIKRFKVRKPAELRSLAGFYLNNVACPMSFSRAAKDLDLTVSTVKKFSDYLEQSYMLSFLKRFSFKYRDVEKSQRKVYSVDTGLSGVMAPRLFENNARLAENVVYHSLKQLQSSDPDIGLYYWKDERHRETDFLVTRENSVTNLIQVCWNPQASPDTKKREITGLLVSMAAFKLNKALILTDDYEDVETIRGKTLYYFPICHWLLNPSTQMASA